MMTKSASTILLIEDNPADSIFLKKLLSNTIFRDWQVIERTCLADALDSPNPEYPSLALLDLSLPDSSGSESFNLLKRNNPNLPIIVLTGMNDLNLATELIKQGAQDYLIKDEINGRLLEKSMDYAIERHHLKIENEKFNDRLLDSVLEAQDRERSRIAKELHDGIVQTLTAISLNLSSLRETLIKCDAKSIEQFEKCVTGLSQTINETRNISHALMPRAVAELGLVNSIESLGSDLSESTNIHFDFLINLNTEPEERMKIVFYRIIQELVNNAVKHSEAKNVIVQLLEYPDCFSLMVEDDGIGFDREEVKKEKNCFGLHSIESRVSSIGGALELDSRHGKGTNVSVSFLKPQ